MPASHCLLALKAIPNAPRNAITGWVGDTLKVKIHAPALGGRANAEVCTFLAERLQLPGRAVTIAHGGRSRQKLVHIAGLTLVEARARLAASDQP